MLTFGHLNTLVAAHWMNRYQLSSTRSIIFELTGLVGCLASAFLKHAPLDRVLVDGNAEDGAGDDTHDNTNHGTLTNGTPATTTAQPTANHNHNNHNNTNIWIPPREIRLVLGQILFYLAMAATSCQLDLHQCIESKLVLNAKKYPVELCKGKSGKYTAYSDQTGITKTQGQTSHSDSTSPSPANTPTKDTNGIAPVLRLPQPNPEDPTTLDVVQTKITEFATERLWNRFHTPRNLVLALIGELGELAEIFQWKGDSTSNATTTAPNGTMGGNSKLSPLELEQVSQEIADVAIYLMRLATICRVKIGDSTLEACAQIGGR
jgi:NTP pyrophosphatase (non-canonical NTP hydrolase)